MGGFTGITLSAGSSWALGAVALSQNKAITVNTIDGDVNNVVRIQTNGVCDGDNQGLDTAGIVNLIYKQTTTPGLPYCFIGMELLAVNIGPPPQRPSIGVGK
jgi:hypothetical protein